MDLREWANAASLGERPGYKRYSVAIFPSPSFVLQGSGGNLPSMKEIVYRGCLRLCLFGIGACILIGCLFGLYLFAIKQVIFGFWDTLRLVLGCVVGIMFMLPVFLMRVRK